MNQGKYRGDMSYNAGKVMNNVTFNKFSSFRAVQPLKKKDKHRLNML